MRWVLWFLFVFALYEAQAMVQNWTEIIIGAIVAAIAVAIVAVEFRASKIDMRVSWGSARALLGVPVKMLRDACMVTLRIARGENLEGFFVRVPLERNPVAIYGVCAAPNTIVADVDDETMVIHKLVATPDD